MDVIFAPGDKEMYPPGDGAGFSTFVVEENLSRCMEGQSRPTHFRGVTTVVAKLFNIVQPDVAVFGAKDYQQAAVIRRMVRDLNFPLKIVVAPTLREADGLAMSSRNKYLVGELRAQAMVLWRALQQARRQCARRRAPSRRRVSKPSSSGLSNARPPPGWTMWSSSTRTRWHRSPKVTRGTHMALAVFIGKTRLIDNARL